MSLVSREARLRGTVVASGVLRGRVPGSTTSPEAFFGLLMGRPLSRWLRDNSASLRPGVARVLDKECYLVEFPRPGAKPAKVWFCPEFGFRPVKMQFSLPRGHRSVTETAELREVAAGLWFPMKAVQRWYIRDPAGGEKMVLYSATEYEVKPESLEVNTGIDDGEFLLRFPTGARVYDGMLRMHYVAGGISESERAIQEFLSSNGVSREDNGPQIRSGPKTSEGDRSMSRQETVANASPLWQTIALLIAGLILLGVVCALVLHRRRGHVT
jgi:hypothetical protein